MPSTATTSGAVHGGDTRYFSATPYKSQTAYGIMVASTQTTKDQKLEMREAGVERWFSKPDHPLADFTTRQNEELRSDKN